MTGSKTSKALRPFVFGVGFGKSGTTSLALIFAESFRSAHEPNQLELISLVLNRDKYTQKEFRGALKGLVSSSLDVNVSQLNGILIIDLVDLYPKAKFILTIREPLEWFYSIINHIRYTKIEEDSIWKEYRDFLFKNKNSQTSIETYTIEDYFRRWLEHNVSVIKAVPADRLLIIRTDKLDDISKIASFLNLPSSSLRLVHHNPGKYDLNFHVNSNLDHLMIKELADKYAKKLYELSDYEL